MNSAEVHTDDLGESAREEGSLTSLSFIGLVLTQFLGAFNDNLFRWLSVPIAEQVVGQSNAIAIGTVCLTVPFLIFSPMAGWLADRFSKRSVIIAFKVAEIGIMLMAVLSILYGNVTALFSVVFLLGSQSALFGPAKFGSIPEILPTRLLSKGNGIMQLTSILAIGLGTVAGFALYDWARPTLGAGNIQDLSAVSFILIGLAVAGTVSSLVIRTAAAGNSNARLQINPITAMVPPLRAVFSDPRLLKTALGISFFMFLGSLSQQNINPYGELILGLSKSDVGILLGILIAGVGCGSVLAGYWSEGKVELGIVPIGAVGIVVSSFFLVAAGWMYTPDYPPKEQFAYWGSCLGLFLLGSSAGLYDVPLEAYLQFRSDRKNRGMVLAGNYLISYVCIVLSAGVFLLLREVLDVSPLNIFLLGGLITIPVAWYVVFVVPDLTFRFFMWLLTHTVYKLRIFGRENIPEKGPGLIVPNHVSFVDGILMMISSSRMIRFVIYADFTEKPFLRRLGQVMRVIPIDASRGPKELVRSIRIAKDAIKDGELVCIFAEGQLTRTGQMQPFQRGMFKIIQGSDAPIIPVNLHGLWGSIFSWRGGKLFWKWPKKWRYPVDIHFGKPLYDVKDPAVVRQQVEELGAEANLMDMKRQPIPAKRFIRHCKANKGRTKVSDSTKQTLEGGKLLAGSLAFRRVLRREVFSPEDKTVGVLLPPSVGGCLANMALALDKRISVNLNYTLSEDVLNYCVDRAGIRHVLTSRKFLEKKPYTLKNAEFVFLEDLKEKVSAVDKAAGAFGAYVMPTSALEASLGLNSVDPNETLTIVFTSGSTGEPKGVVLSHSNVGANIEAVDHLLNLNDNDALLGVLPFFHSFGYTACMWLPLCYNVRGVYHFNPLDAKIVGRLCQENRATILMATPTFLQMYLRRCDKEQLESLDLIVVGAEKLPEQLAREFEAKFGVLPTEGYGTTELSPVAAVNIPDHRSTDIVQRGTKLGTVGRPLPGVTAKVVDPDTGEDRGIGAEGLLLIKGPNVMQGYLDEPERTAEVLKDGWYCTGDFASIDSEGFVSITGRQSRFSKIGGEMVPHIRIEQELTRICHDCNDEEGEILLAVTAVPDDRKGEKLVVLHRPLHITPEEAIKQLSSTGLPKIWLPSRESFVEVESIPVLGTGKLDLRGIKELALERFCQAELQA
ncbi:Bifunctional protein Aas [Thalassoglobus neptunius]|uniref:Bifunctional protein Aas n=1 Tax=Thalassoglobus neptunius TaxID=1938619 RepID=A0A5C5X4U3_9PLAN|nr:acyl-[ACP]--phospholipid O-acyltransferase [Thalassoglobus neptunius]TWT57920.1 Bifunctional protein Aas [Thalassoglobus neptunius]